MEPLDPQPPVSLLFRKLPRRTAIRMLVTGVVFSLLLAWRQTRMPLPVRGHEPVPEPGVIATLIPQPSLVLGALFGLVLLVLFYAVLMVVAALVGSVLGGGRR